MAVRDLSIYADSIQAKLKHYRDSSGREVDAIVELRNGNYAAIEVKIYSDENIKDAFASLNKFEKALKQDGLKLLNSRWFSLAMVLATVKMEYTSCQSQC